MTNYNWIDKYKAAEIVSIHWKTLEAWRKAPNKDFQQGIHYQSVGGKFLWNEILLRDWLAHQHDPISHLAAIEQYQNSLAVNQPKCKRT
jgi:hypothetical protein